MTVHSSYCIDPHMTYHVQRVYKTQYTAEPSTAAAAAAVVLDNQGYSMHHSWSLESATNAVLFYHVSYLTSSLGRCAPVPFIVYRGFSMPGAYLSCTVCFIFERFIFSWAYTLYYTGIDKNVNC